MNKVIKLNGFDYHNLLAFLALLGLLKTLNESRPEWKPCISWIDWIPHLHISSVVDNEQITCAVLEGLIKIGNTMRFGQFKNLNLKYEEFKDLQDCAPPEIMIALGSDGIIQNNKNVEYPPLCTMLGQGHQNFLPRLKNATKVNGDAEHKQAMDNIANVLFNEWKYKDESKITFRWDPKEYRPHGYRAKDPSKDTFLPVIGANRLAAVGFTNYWCVPTKGGLSTVACKKDRNRVWKTFWPIWSKKLSLDAILVLMRHPYMKAIQNGKIDDDARMNLYKMGVCHVISADIFWFGKFRNVTSGRSVM